MGNSNFRFYSIRPEKLKYDPTYQPTSGCAEPESARLKVELTRENGKYTSKTGTKDYI